MCIVLIQVCEINPFVCTLYPVATVLQHLANYKSSKLFVGNYGIKWIKELLKRRRKLEYNTVGVDIWKR